MIDRGFCHLTNIGDANAFLQATAAAIAEKHCTNIVKKKIMVIYLSLNNERDFIVLEHK